MKVLEGMVGNGLELEMGESLEPEASVPAEAAAYR